MPAQTISPILTDASSVMDMGPGGVLNQLPSLKATADFERTKLTVLNDYKDTNADQYGASHPRATSDGDDFGKGTGVFLDTVNGGSQLDIIERKNEIKINEYQPNKPYTTPSA